VSTAHLVIFTEQNRIAGRFTAARKKKIKITQLLSGAQSYRKSQQSDFLLGHPLSD
jgi:hypothetical protein